MEITTSKKDHVPIDSSSHSLMHEHIYLELRDINRRVSDSISGQLTQLLPTRNSLKQALRCLCKSPPVTVILVIFTLFSLTGDDVRLLTMNKQADPAVDACLLTVMGTFTLEIGLGFWLRPEYRWSMYFWLDILSTLSLVPDVGWFRESAFGQGIQTGVMPAQNAFRASRAGSRTTKIVRFLRLFRILRLVRLYRATHTAVGRNVSQVQDDLPIPTESRIGRKFTELTTKRVISIVLLLLVLLPLCEVSVYVNQSMTSWTYGTEAISNSFGTEKWMTVVQRFITYHEADSRPLLFFSIQSPGLSFTWNKHENLDNLRLTEKYIAVAGDVVAVFDLRADTKLEAELSLFRTFFICLTFAIGVYYLTKDANDMVIVPIEKMMHKIKRISENPLSPMDERLNDVYDLDTVQRCCNITTVREKETAVLENSILKICALLGLSFGEAGSAIISSNFEKTGKVNLMLEGTKVRGIFGLCDVRNFTDTTEVLQEDIMVFINEIASIVHYTVTAHLGAPNKNIGDAFLFVWKPPVDASISYLTNLADLAIISCLKILSYLSSSPHIVRYRSNPQLLRRMHNYTVKLGFGLHYGWAIEGPMGSDLKIDVSYLSPHVIITEQMQELTKKYGVSVIFSSFLYDIFSAPVQTRCRHIDTVLFRASPYPMRIYAFDVETDFMLDTTQRLFSKEIAKKKKNELMEDMKNPGFHAFLQFSYSKKLLRLKALIEEEFFSLFSLAVLAYEKGEWETSRLLLDKALNMTPNDRPAEVMYQMMLEHDFKCPLTWKGYREAQDL